MTEPRVAKIAVRIPADMLDDEPRIKATFVAFAEGMGMIPVNPDNLDTFEVREALSGGIVQAFVEGDVRST